MFTIKDDVEFCLLPPPQGYPPLPTCSNRRFQGFDDKQQKKDIDFDHVHCGTRQAVQFRFFVYRSKHASLPIAMKKAGGSFRKALD